MLVCMTMCAISLGGNLGDVPATFAAAIRQLTASPIISDVRLSRLYRTVPMGANAGETFWNAAAVFETSAAPLEILDQLQQLEQACGRVRTLHWGPRTLDLDLMLYGDLVIDSPRLTVPHPAMWHRRFVLDPLVELVPDAIHPIFHRAVVELKQRLQQRPLLVGWVVPTGFSSLRELVGTAHPTKAVAPDALHTAAILFAGQDVHIPFPQVIRLSDDQSEAQQQVTHILTAALDEPVAIESG